MASTEKPSVDPWDTISADNASQEYEKVPGRPSHKISGALILPVWFDAAISIEAWLLPDCFITADFSGIAATFAPVVEY
jgi:hypothetical protein